MTYAEVLENARKNIGNTCKVCPVCNGLACGNTMPGPGSKAPGNGANDNFRAWGNIKLNMDTIAENSSADPSCTLFGREFSMPLMSGPIGSIKRQFNPESSVIDYNDAVFEACSKSGILATFADGLAPEILERGLAGAGKFGGNAVPIINPHADEEIKEKLALVNASAPIAAGIVIDSAGLPHLRAMNTSAGAKTVEQLAELKKYCKVPLIFKGLMTAKGAEKAVRAGADAIIVSNHGGRVLAQTPATAEVLPEIVSAVGKDVMIIVDGGIRSGLDIFKALALGADAALVCRPFIIGYYGGGAEGIGAVIEKYRAELTDTMYMCGARSVSDICADMIR